MSKECSMAKGRFWGGFNSKKALKYHIFRIPFKERLAFEMKCRQVLQDIPKDQREKITTLLINNKLEIGNVDFVVQLRGGICNRLRTMFRHCEQIQELTQKLRLTIHLYIIWTPSEHCVQLFNDLFHSYPGIHFIDQNENISTICVDSYTSEFPLRESYYEKLRPRKDMLTKIKKLISQPFIAIHVRRTDHIELAKSKNKFTTDEEFFSFLDKYHDYPIFLATDNVTTQNIFKKKYGTRIFWNKNITNTQNRRHTTEKDAIIDLYVCAHANFFLGSGYSSFTDTISILSSILRNTEKTHSKKNLFV